VWNSRDVILQTLPAKASLFVSKNWISPLQPAKLKEEIVKPGEIGSFEFTIRKNSKASHEIQTLVPMVRGLGRIRGRSVKLKVESKKFEVQSDESENDEKQDTQISAEEIQDSSPKANQPVAEESKVESSITPIRIKLGFVSPRIEVGGGSFQIRQLDKTLFQGSFADFESTKMQEGEYFRLIPAENVFLEIPNWERKSWNGALNYNKFRGIIEIRKEGENLVMVNELPLEEYLWGIAEPAPSDPVEKKKLMAILARSYALFYTDPAHRKFPGKMWDGSDSPAEFQQYLGYNYEIHGKFREFVEMTHGLVVKFEGKVVKTPYFTSSSGITKTAAEAGWNTGDFKFIKKVKDPWSCGLNSDALVTNFSCPENARGHGVGVSGKGAAGLAREGKTYEEILDYFFKEVEVGEI